MAMDGSNFEVPYEPDNIAAFGYPGSRTGVAGGKLRVYLTSLRRTCTSAVGCCAARRPIWCAKSSTAGCWPTMQCAGSCTQQAPRMRWSPDDCLSWPLCSCCAAHSPNPGPFPPVHPYLRKRWFDQVLAQAAALICVSSRGRSNPRMVKRRNSPYASHDRARPLNQPQNFHPILLPPLPLTKRKWYSQAKNA